MAQFGRALRSGRRGRWFKSSRIDTKSGVPSGTPDSCIHMNEVVPAVFGGAERRTLVQTQSHQYRKRIPLGIRFFFVFFQSDASSQALLSFPIVLSAVIARSTARTTSTIAITACTIFHGSSPATLTFAMIVRTSEHSVTMSMKIIGM